MSGLAEPRLEDKDPVTEAKQLLARQERVRGSVRVVLEALVLLLVVLAFILFTQSILLSQSSLAEDRAGLMTLRERWGALASIYGLRGDRRTYSEDFFTEYKRFKERPSFKAMLRDDPPFAALAIQADLALHRLSLAEVRGDPNARRAAQQLDELLADMAHRVGAYSKERLEAARRSFFLLIPALAAASGAFFFLERRLRASRADETRSRALNQALISAEEGVRLRLSRELHDAVAQDLAAAKLYCSLASGEDAKKAGNLIERSIGEIREICHGLRPAELDRLGLEQASARLCSDTAREASFEVRFRSEGLAAFAIEAETEINIYRILQEALTNAKRHSAASVLRVSLRGLRGIRGRTGAIELKVEDDGKGPGSAEPGLGRTGMEERARMIGASFHFGTAQPTGTLVVVRAPVREKEVL